MLLARWAVVYMLLVLDDLNKRFYKTIIICQYLPYIDVPIFRKYNVYVMYDFLDFSFSSQNYHLKPTSCISLREYLTDTYI